MDEENYKGILFAVIGAIALVLPFILLYMWRPERLKRLEEESKLKSTKI